MLRWEQINDDTWYGLSGEWHVVRIDREDDDLFSWEADEISGFRSGEESTLEAAKSACEAAFRAWCRDASLAHVPDGYVLVPVEPDVDQLSALFGRDYLCQTDKTQALWIRRWRTMIAAAPDHFRDYGG